MSTETHKGEIPSNRGDYNHILDSLRNLELGFTEEELKSVSRVMSDNMLSQNLFVLGKLGSASYYAKEAYKNMSNPDFISGYRKFRSLLSPQMSIIRGEWSLDSESDQLPGLSLGSQGASDWD